MGEPGNELDDATESEDKTVALLIAILALFLALSETGAKKAEHLSTEKNIEASDLYNFYQAKKARSTVIEAAAQAMEAISPALTDENAKASAEKQMTAWKKVDRQFRERSEEARGQLGEDPGTGERGKGSAGAFQQTARAFRIRQRRAADLDRSRLRRDYHRRGDAGLDRRRARRDRRRF